MNLPEGCKRGIPLLKRIVPNNSLPTSADVVIIGGGIIGVSAALDLSSKGYSVLICEKGIVGGEQSSRNWGWVRQMGRDVSEMPLTIASLDIWRNFSSRKIDTGFKESGIAYVAKKSKDIDQLDEWFKHGLDHEIKMKRLTGNEVESLIPGLSKKESEALYTHNDGRAEPGEATPAIAKAAQNNGATILENCAVRGLDYSGGRISGVVTEIGLVKTSSVIVATGAWSRIFLQNSKIRFPQLRVIGTAARIESQNIFPEMPIGGNDFAIRKRNDGGYTVAQRNANVAPITPDSFKFIKEFFPTLIDSWGELKIKINKMTISEFLREKNWSMDDVSPFEKSRILDPDPDLLYLNGAIKRLKRAFPNHGDVKVTHAWAGVIDATPDAIPAIGEIPGHKGLFLASGFSGHGFGIGPGAGRLISELVTNDRPVVNPKPFSPDRFIV